jgi:perosamine synthetase
LFGLIANMKSICELLRFNGSFVVEDAAQAAGALYNGKNAGTLGDVAFFSLGRGKSISTIQGGIIITDNDLIAENITKIIHSIHTGKIGHEICLLAKALGLSVFLHPERYYIPQMLPFLNLGANVYDLGFKIEGFSKVQANLGHRLFCKLEEYNFKRCQNAQSYKVRFSESASFNLPKIPEGSQPIYLRFPIIFRKKHLREYVFNVLTKYRLGANKNFPHPLNEINGFKPFLVNGKSEFPGAKHLTKALLTLPTHPMVERRDLEKIIQIMSELL